MDAAVCELLILNFRRNGQYHGNEELYVNQENVGQNVSMYYHQGHYVV
jgi:hypothetical protein